MGKLGFGRRPFAFWSSRPDRWFIWERHDFPSGGGYYLLGILWLSVQYTWGR